MPKLTNSELRAKYMEYAIKYIVYLFADEIFGAVWQVANVFSFIRTKKCEKQKSTAKNRAFFLVPREGLEPSRHC